MATVQGAGAVQEVPWATVNLLRPFFTPGWRCLDETVLTGNLGSVTLPSAGTIPGHFRTLALFYQARTDRAVTAEYVLGRLNADGGPNYHRQYGYFRGDNTQGSGSGFGQTSFYAGIAYGANGLANTFCPNEMQFQGYALADRYKHVGVQVQARFDAAAAANVEIDFYGGLWLNTNAITSITLFPEVGPNFVAGSRFTLYGIL